MTQLNDLQFKSLEDQGYTGTFNDKEYAWLFDQGCTIRQLNDRWHCFLAGQGYSGTNNDMLFKYLGDKGCLQPTLQDRWFCALNGGSFYDDVSDEPMFYAGTYKREIKSDKPTTEWTEAEEDEGVAHAFGTELATFTHPAPIWAMDYEGVARAFAANEPVWEGGRVITNKFTHT